MSDQVFLYLPSSVLQQNFVLNNGKVLPKITFGVTHMEKYEDVYNAVDVALETGYRSFDCSPVHRGDENLGRALEELLPKHNLRRTDLIISCKLHPRNYGDVKEAFWKSCENLRTDYIDIYLMQWPGGYNLNYEDEKNEIVREETWKEVLKLLSSGAIKSSGVCNFTTKHLRSLRSCSDKLPAVNQVEFHPKCPQIDLLDYCQENNILLQSISFEETFHPLVLNNVDVKNIASDLKKTPTQVLLKWTINKGVAVISQSKKPNKIRQNFQVFDFVLDRPTMCLINQISAREKYLRNPICVI